MHTIKSLFVSIGVVIYFSLPTSAFPPHSPDSISDLWEDFSTWDESMPLEIEIIQEWNEEEAIVQLLRYSLGHLHGTNKQAEPGLAAYYGFPKKGENLPAIIHLHGGGQRANKRYVKYWVRLGYVAISINWGGKVLENEETPNTDWDGLAAGFIGDKDQTHHNDHMPGPHTLFAEPHPFNSSWVLIQLAARRTITFLEQHPRVNADKIGLTGHSMGGRAAVFTAIDPRLKAVSPSVGGSGFLYDDLWGLPGSARNMDLDILPVYKKYVDCSAYWPLIKCPILFLGATNDFNSPTELVIQGMRLLPESTNSRLALAPHLNHRFTSGTFASRALWFDAHLKKIITFPKTARAEVILRQADGIPLFKVYPDTATNLPLKKVDIYYGYARDPRIRFWRDGLAEKVDNHWQAKCPLFYTDEPLFAFANLTYELDRSLALPAGYDKTIRKFTFSSQYRVAYPSELQKAGVRATEKPRRLIDDFSRGFQDWYLLSPENTKHWFFSTRKIVDPAWVGPKKGQLAFKIENPQAGNILAVVARTNDWIGYTGRKKDVYTAVVPLDRKGRVAVSLAPADFKNDQDQLMSDWDQITELSFRPADKALPDDTSFSPWQGKVPTLYNLHWKGGTFIERPKIHTPKKDFEAFYSASD